MSTLVRRAIVGAALLIVLTGCGEDAPDATPVAPPSTPGSGSSPSPGAAEDVDPDRELRSAIDRLLGAGTGSYEVTVTVDSAGSAGSVDRGRFDLSSESWEQLHARVLGGEEDTGSVTHHLTTGGPTLMRVESDTDDGWPCWVPAAAVEGQVAPVGGSSRPPAVTVAAGATGSGRWSSAIVGTVDLAASAQLMGDLVSFPDLDPDSRADATFTIDDGLLTGIDIRTGDLFVALVESGAFPNMSTADAAASTGSITIRFTEVGADVTLTAPPTAEVIDPSDGRSLASAMADCGRP